jgi:NAD(P)-dependent dehydrogenase (short-subunit alcohol dehydrogenase family)
LNYRYQARDGWSSAAVPGRAWPALASPAGTDPETVLGRAVAAMDIPLDRAGPAREVAELIAFLALPGTAYLAGGQFIMDGGVLPTLQGDS